MKYLFVVALLLGLSPVAFGSCDGTTIEHPVVDGDRTWNLAKDAYGSDTKTANMLGTVWDLSTIASGHIAHIAPGDIIVLPCVKKAPLRTHPMITAAPIDQNKTYCNVADCPDDAWSTDDEVLSEPEQPVTPLAPLQVAEATVVKEIDDGQYSMRETNESVAKYLALRRAAQNTPKLEMVAVAEVIPTRVPVPKPVQKKVKVAKAPKPPKQKQPNSYETSYTPKEVVRGIRVDSFPAVLLSKPKESGEWGHREKIWARVVKTDNQFSIIATTEKKPSTATFVAVDFGNGDGYSYRVSEATVKESAAKPPKDLPEKAYDVLNRTYPTKDGLVVRGARLSLQVGTRVGFAWWTGNPRALIAIGTDIASEHVGKKRQALISPPPLNVQYSVTLQGAQIEMLEGEMERLKKELASLRQNTNSTIAGNLQKGVRK